MPFSAWITVPDAFAWALHLGVPLLMFAAGAGFALRTRARFENSPLAFFMMSVLMESRLTMAVYGVNLFWAY